MPQTQPSEVLRPQVVQQQAAQRVGVAYWKWVSGGVAGGEPGDIEKGPFRERLTYPTKREKGKWLFEKCRLGEDIVPRRVSKDDLQWNLPFGHFWPLKWYNSGGKYVRNRQCYVVLRLSLVAFSLYEWQSSFSHASSFSLKHPLSLMDHALRILRRMFGYVPTLFNISNFPIRIISSIVFVHDTSIYFQHLKRLPSERCTGTF